MGVISYNSDRTSLIPSAKLFKAFILDSDNLLTKIMPQAIKGVQVTEGNGGPGTVKLVTFGEGPHKSLKHKVDELDKENFIYKYTIIDGDILEGVLDKISYVVKFEATPDGGSICKTHCTYYTKGNAQLTEDQINGHKETLEGMFKAVEAYLLANPDAYN